MHNLVKKILTLNPLFVVSAIFMFALFVRIYHLGTLPSTFQEDEVLAGYVGRFILSNGKDIYGNPWPLLYFNKFGDYYIVAPMYLAGLSTFIFGVTEFAVRFPVAFFGSLVVFPVYAFCTMIYKRREVGYIGAFLISITPWHVILSRGMVEGIIGTTVMLTGIIFLLRSVQDKSVKKLIYSVLLLGSTYAIYHPFRLYVPMLFFPIYFLYPQLVKSRAFFIKLIVIHLFFISLTAYISTTPWGSGRLVQTSIFSDLAGVDRRVQESIFNIKNGNIIVARFFHNKPAGYAREYASQYLSYFSPGFLFMKGGAESRYDVPDQGLLYITYLFLAAAIAIPLKSRESEIDNKMLFYSIFLILMAPIPAAFTYLGSPNIHRSAFLVVALIVPLSYGFYKLTRCRFGGILIPVVLLALLYESFYFAHQYKTQADVYTSLRRNDGYRELVRYVQKHKDEYDRVFLPAEGNTALYYLFYTKDFDRKYSKEFGYDALIPKVDKVEFVNKTCPTESPLGINPGENVLVVNRHSCTESTIYKKYVKIQGVNDLLGFTTYRNK